MAIIADDLTGACDTALQFFRGGHETWVAPVPGGEVPPGLTAIAVNTDSRDLDEERARRRVAESVEWLRLQGFSNFYKKVDSTLRGNLRAEIEETLAAAEEELAVVAPAFPQADRTTVGGVQLVGGVPVSLTPYGEEVGSPAQESHLPTLLDGDLVDFRTVAKGPAFIAAAIAACKKRVLVADASRPKDLSAIAEAIRLSPRKILPVGSAGLALALQTRWLIQSARPISLAKGKPVVILNGSANPVSLGQLDRLNCRVLQVDVHRVLLADFDPEEFARRALQQILAGLDVAVTTVRNPLQVTMALKLGHELGMDALGVGDMLSSALGAIAKRLHGVELGGMVLMGGQTAFAACEQIGWLRIV
ncbi:MAG TPA: four-carbon acid sugar kinase family protein, partial [Chroococcales cyanobacterium]